ncbi:MAG: type II toxin-antitoxin system PemK/MazF family toxin [Oscillospiraceae bacterium]|nr:type II toxin-antitoxin system PemK/MazF family toxin [Oscillospiraceae bacterium]
MKRGGKGISHRSINSAAAWDNESDLLAGTTWRRSVNFVDTIVRRGDIFYADLSPVVGSEQGGVRPVLIVQNDTGNRHSPTVIAAAITSQTGKANMPTHISVAATQSGLPRDSVILLEQVRTLDKRRLRERMGRVDRTVMEQVDTAIAVSLGLPHSRLV